MFTEYMNQCLKLVTMIKIINFLKVTDEIF